jgi:hypothetical protein
VSGRLLEVLGLSERSRPDSIPADISLERPADALRNTNATFHVSSDWWLANSPESLREPMGARLREFESSRLELESLDEGARPLEVVESYDKARAALTLVNEQREACRRSLIPGLNSGLRGMLRHEEGIVAEERALQTAAEGYLLDAIQEQEAALNGFLATVDELRSTINEIEAEVLAQDNAPFRDAERIERIQERFTHADSQKRRLLDWLARAPHQNRIAAISREVGERLAALRGSLNEVDIVVLEREMRDAMNREDGLILNRNRLKGVRGSSRD